MDFKKIILFLTLMSTLLVGCATKDVSTSANEQKIDNLKDEQKPLPRISVASVSISQVLDAMQIDIVGKPETKLALPERYKNVEEIGTSHSPNFEKILEINTELLIGDELFKDKLDKTAKEYNIDTFYAKTGTYEDFLNTIEELGKKLDKEEEATKVIKSIKESIKKYEGKENDKKVAIIFGTSESHQLATENSYVGSLVKKLGAKNIATIITEKDTNALADNNSSYINLSIEQILENQPDIILRFGHGNIDAAKESFKKLFDENVAWKTLDAVKNNEVYDLDSSIFGVSANMRISEALEQLGEILYKE